MKKGVVIFICAVTIYACKHTVVTPIIPTTDSTGGSGPGTGTGFGTGTPQVICFESDILPIFKSSCAKSGCHDVASKQDGYILDSYANIVRKGIRPGNAEDSDIYEAITEDDDDDRMPRPPNPRLTLAQIGLIKKWINEGAKNTTNCASVCDLNVFSYSAAIRPILDANCVGCHNDAAAPLGINLTQYASVKTVASNGRLLGAINHQQGFSPMPKGSAKLSDCKIAQIQKWVQAGAPNN